MMAEQQLQRPITSGSRQAPDPYDQYLESRGLYRKHTARDASSLFRAIAEQMYDTQMLNYEVRLECVRFMTQKRRIFERYIAGDFDAYMLDMSKPKTYGTLLELRAMCCMYRRNVILYEPFNLGTVVTFNRRYRDNFRVFFTTVNHFDSVYELEYIEMAAISQSITFKLLYKMLFKLPDVNFAIESMLHPHSFEWGQYEVDFDDQGYMIRLRCGNGRFFELDLPENTKCILENFKLCSFHNSSQRLEREQHQLVRVGSGMARRDLKLDIGQAAVAEDDRGEMLLMCPNRLVSCVRQLLDDGITPFPYKVAKSLDPFMYRNIEFDCWNDLRKEAKRYNAYAGDYNFKVGAKCRVEMENDSELYTCHIQKISTDKSYCIVYVEQFGKKLLVPYESVHPLPPDEFRPWTLPYRYQRQLHRMHLSKFVSKSNKMQKWKKTTKVFDMGNYFEATKCDIVQMHQYIQLDHCYQSEPRPQQQQREPREQVAELQELPIPEKESREPRFQLHHKMSSQPTTTMQEASAHAAPTTSVNHFMNYLPMQGGRPGPSWTSTSPLGLNEEFQYPVPSAAVTPPVTAEGCMYMPFGGYVQQPPPNMPMPPPPMPFIPFSPTLPPHQTQARRSLQFSGEDLPADVGTLRYFYNMGVDMHMRMAHQQVTPPEECINTFNFNNTDQLQQQKSNASEEAGNAMVNPITPPSPEAVVHSEPISANGGDKSYMRSKRSNNFFNQTQRGKRPDPLHEIKDNLGLAVLLPTPTPTPSPTTSGNQFNFYPTSPGGPTTHLARPAHMRQQAPPPPPPPGTIFFHKAGPPPLGVGNGQQNPYAWGMAAPPPPPNIISLSRYDLLGNFPVENNATVQAQASPTRHH